MAVCKFYSSGRCKNGDNCRFSHPGAGRPQDDQNSFAALNQGGGRYNSINNGSNNNTGGRPQGPSRGDNYRPNSNATLPYLISREAIQADFTTEKPIWPLSVYGPGRDAPRQLLPDIEYSMEEMRLQYYIDPQAAVQNEQRLLQQSTQEVNQVLQRLDDAIQYVVAGKDEHPNRLDMCISPEAGSQPPPRTFFGAAAANPAQTGSAFGQPSLTGANAQKPAFGAPAFGAPNQPGGFGQPSAFGQSNGFGQQMSANQGSAFGQASTMNQGSAFGQPSAPGQSGGFGQPSALGAKPSFGQPSAPAQNGGFGQPSALGQGGGFGQPSAMGQSTGFGQASALGQSAGLGKPAFGQSGFGQATSLGRQASPFAQAGGTAGSASPFASAGSNQQSSAFGQALSSNSNQGAGAFGQPAASANQNSFGQAAVGPSQGAFGQPATIPAAQNAFGQPTAPASQSAFGQPTVSSSQSPFGQPAAPVQSGLGMASTPTIQNSFGQPSAAAGHSAFGKPTAPAGQSPFGQASTNGQSVFGQQAKPSPFATQPAQSQQQQSPFGLASGQSAPTQLSTGSNNSTTPDVSTYTTRLPNGQLRLWKGSRVDTRDNVPLYQQADGSWQRIFFPDGPPRPNPDNEDKPEAYTDAIQAAYAFLAESGTFKDGIMPEVPPKCDWIRFDV